MAATDYDYLATKNDLIEGALSIIGKFFPGESLSYEDYKRGSDALNQLVQDWQNDHIFIWSISKFTITTVIGTTNYIAPTEATTVAPFIAIDSAYYTDEAGQDYPLEVLAWTDYLTIPDKEETSGVTISISWDQRNNRVYVYPKPVSALVITIVGASKLKDWDLSSGSGDVPSRYQKALKYALAADLADHYQLTTSEKKYISQKADVAFNKAKRSEKDLSTCEFIQGAYRR